MKNITQKILTSVTALTMIVGATSIVPPVQAGDIGWRAQCEYSYKASEGNFQYRNTCTVYNKANENRIVVHFHDLNVLNIRKGSRPGLVTIDGLEGVWKFNRVGCGLQFTRPDEIGTATYTVKCPSN